MLRMHYLFVYIDESYDYTIKDYWVTLVYIVVSGQKRQGKAEAQTDGKETFKRKAKLC